MRNRSRVGDRHHHNATRLKRTNRHFTPRTWPLDEDVDLSESVLLSTASCRLRSDLRRKGCALARTLEAVRPRARPRNHIASGIGQRDDRIIERRLDVRLASGDILPVTTPNPALA